jgi:hypothetical protein
LRLCSYKFTPESGCGGCSARQQPITECALRDLRRFWQGGLKNWSGRSGEPNARERFLEVNVCNPPVKRLRTVPAVPASPPCRSLAWRISRPSGTSDGQFPFKESNMKTEAARPHATLRGSLRTRRKGASAQLLREHIGKGRRVERSFMQRAGDRQVHSRVGDGNKCGFKGWSGNARSGPADRLCVSGRSASSQFSRALRCAGGPGAE